MLSNSVPTKLELHPSHNKKKVNSTYWTISVKLFGLRTNYKVIMAISTIPFAFLASLQFIPRYMKSIANYKIINTYLGWWTRRVDIHCHSNLKQIYTHILLCYSRKGPLILLANCKSFGITVTLFA